MMRDAETKDRSNELRFLIKKEEESSFIAICLEHYIGAQGQTFDEVVGRLKTAYRAELNDSVQRTGVPFSGIPRAPEEYQRMYESNDGCLHRGTIYDINSFVELAA